MRVFLKVFIIQITFQIILRASSKRQTNFSTVVFKRYFGFHCGPDYNTSITFCWLYRYTLNDPIFASAVKPVFYDLGKVPYGNRKRWSLWTGGCYLEVDVSSGLSVSYTKSLLIRTFHTRVSSLTVLKCNHYIFFICGSRTFSTQNKNSHEVYLCLRPLFLMMDTWRGIFTKKTR